MPEATGVGGQARIQQGGQVDIQRHAEPAQQLVNQHYGGVGRRIDEMLIAEIGIGHVMIDDQHRNAVTEKVGQPAQSFGRSGVDGHDQIERVGGTGQPAVGGRHQMHSRQLRKRLWDGTRDVEAHRDRCAGGLQSEGQRHRGPQRVRVRIVVRQQ